MKAKSLSSTVMSRGAPPPHPTQPKAAAQLVVTHREGGKSPCGRYGVTCMAVKLHTPSFPLKYDSTRSLRAAACRSAWYPRPGLCLS